MEKHGLIWSTGWYTTWDWSMSASHLEIVMNSLYSKSNLWVMFENLEALWESRWNHCGTPSSSGDLSIAEICIKLQQRIWTFVFASLCLARLLQPQWPSYLKQNPKPSLHLLYFMQHEPAYTSALIAQHVPPSNTLATLFFSFNIMSNLRFRLLALRLPFGNIMHIGRCTRGLHPHYFH